MKNEHPDLLKPSDHNSVITSYKQKWHTKYNKINFTNNLPIKLYLEC